MSALTKQYNDIAVNVNPSYMQRMVQRRNKRTDEYMKLNGRKNNNLVLNWFKETLTKTGNVWMDTSRKAQGWVKGKIFYFGQQQSKWKEN